MSSIQYLAKAIKLFGGFPSKIIVVDGETTGFKLQEDVFWNWATVMYEDGRIVSERNYVLNWTHESVRHLIEPAWLETKIARQQAGMRSNNRQSQLTMARLQAGSPPFEVMLQILTELREAKSAGYVFAGHGIINYDIPRISYQLKEWLGELWLCSRDKILDTAVLEKSIEARILPATEETFFAFSRRVLSKRVRGVSWNLDEHCATKYDLLTKAKLNKEQFHLAINDCYACLWLLKTYHSFLQSQDDNVQFERDT